MKKYIVSAVLLGVIVLGIVYYDKNIRYGTPRERDVPFSEGFHFDNAISEKSIGYWRNGNFQIALAYFDNQESTNNSFEQKRKTYIELAQLNNGESFEKEISGHQALVVKFSDGSYLILLKGKNKLAHITNNNRNEEENETFAKWFIRWIL